jgi:hypothetical protein
VSLSIFPTLTPKVTVSREIIDESEVFRTVSGREQRVGWDFYPLHRYSLKYEALRSGDAYREAQRIAGFYERHRGRLDSFLFRDPEDCSVTDHGFGVGDGTTTVFQLQRTTIADVEDVLGVWPTYTTPRTNYCPYSQQFDAWTKTGAATVTANAKIAPDGTATADRLNFPSASTVDRVTQQTSGGSLAVATPWTFSVWLCGVAGQTCRIVIDTNGGTYETAILDVTLTTAWRRYSVTLTFANAGHTAVFGFVQRSTGQTAATVDAWGAQIEDGVTLPRRYVATAATAATAVPAYWPGIGDGFEPVGEPNWATVSVTADGVFVAGFAPGATGQIVFTSPPANGAHLRWSGEFFRRCRFEDTSLSQERLLAQLWRGNVSLIEVKP